MLGYEYWAYCNHSRSLELHEFNALLGERPPSYQELEGKKIGLTDFTGEDMENDTGGESDTEHIAKEENHPCDRAFDRALDDGFGTETTTSDKLVDNDLGIAESDSSDLALTEAFALAEERSRRLRKERVPFWNDTRVVKRVHFTFTSWMEAMEISVINDAFDVGFARYRELMCCYRELMCRKHNHHLPPGVLPGMMDFGSWFNEKYMVLEK